MTSNLCCFPGVKLQKKGKVCEREEANAATSSSFLDDGGDDGFEYDVFLSFRGEDTRKGFTGHLYEALQTRGVSAFLDSERLEKGTRIDELLRTIENSEIFVPVFSKGYAESKWCLREIATAVKMERLILPLFFDVDPRDVKNQTGRFREAFRKHERELDGETVKGWREALRKAGEVSGFDLRTETDGHEAKLIQVIVKRILSEFNRTPLNVATHPVGIEARVDDMMKLLDIDSDDVRIVGIHGMGGIGKTTIAKAVYNEVFHKFDCRSFIANVGERSKHAHDGLVRLQMQLIHDLFKDDDSTIFDPVNGMGILRRRVHRKRVLIILDDVNDKDQLHYLAGNRSWFHKGSRIIITTRNESILVECKVREHEIYKPKELEPKEALQLFTYHAFMTNKLTREYVDLSKKVVATSGGLPLALEIYGSLFFDAKTREDWEEMLDKLKHIQHQGIQKKLKISYDELYEEEKSIFLDIACFFIGKDRENATLMWKSCNLFPYSAIRVLMHRSLVKINEETGEFEMHDLIRDVGRSIVRQECHSNPGKRSRLWNQSEITEVLQNFIGSDAVEGITLDQSNERYLSTKAFDQMHNLRLLHIQLTNFQDDFSYFPSKLKWLELKWCKFNSHFRRIEMPSSSNQPGVNLQFQRVLLSMKFDKLVVLNISNCDGMVVTPDFSGVPNLVKLTLDGCVNLEEVHESIGCLKSLVLLSMRCCGKLQELPGCCDRLIALEVLILSYCFVFTTLPKRLGNMKSLRKLILDYTRICYLPDSTTELSNLFKLSLAGCGSLKALPNNLGRLDCLEELRVTGTAVDGIPESVGELMKLRVLDAASCSSLTMLPESLGILGELEILSLDDCIKLEGLPESIGLLGKLRMLSVNGCKTLKSLPASMAMLKNLHNLRMAGTRVNKLPQDIGSLSTLQTLDISRTDSLQVLPLNLTSLEEVLACGSYLFETSADFKNLSSLKCLKLDDSHILHLTPSVSGFSRLQQLSLDKCRWLETLPRLPPSLLVLSARRCIRLRAIPQVSNLKDLRKLDLFLCMNLTNIGGFEELKSVEDVNLLSCTRLGNAFKHQLLKDALIFEYLKSFNISSTVAELGNYGAYFEKPNTLRSPNEEKIFLILPDNQKPLLPRELDVNITVKRLVGETLVISKVAYKCSPDDDDEIMIWLRSDSLKVKPACYAISFEEDDQLFQYMGASNYTIDVFPASQGSVTMTNPEMTRELKIFHTSSWFEYSTWRYHDRVDMLVMILPNGEDWIVPIQLVVIEVASGDMVTFRTVRAAHRYSDYLHSFFERPCYVVDLKEDDQVHWHKGRFWDSIHVTPALENGAPFGHLKWCHASSRFRGLVHRPPFHGFIKDKLSFPIPRTPMGSEVFINKLVLKSSGIRASKLEIPIEVETGNRTVFKVTMTAIRRPWYVEEKFDECQCKSCSEKKELWYYISTFDRDHEIHKFLGHANTEFCVPCDFSVPRSGDLFLEYSPTM